MSLIAPSVGAGRRSKPGPWTLATNLKVGLLAGISLVLMLTVQIPLFPAAPFLTWDLSDVPALVAGFALGPLPGMAVEVLKNVLFLLHRPTPHELVGVPMNTLAGVAFVGSASLFYWRRKTRTRAAVALALGTLAMTLLMVPANLVVYPFFAWLFTGENMDLSALRTLVLLTVTPFNLLKGALSGTLTFLCYKRFSNFLRRW